MRRLRLHQKIGLKHMPFFEALGIAEDESATDNAVLAGLLVLRLVDHWVLVGPAIVAPESVSVRGVRKALMKLSGNDLLREVLLGIVNTMQTLREVDLLPILPRLFAYSKILERRAEFALARDVYESIIRLGDEELEADLLADAYDRFGACCRRMGAFAEAEVAYTAVGRIATQNKLTRKLLHSRIGLANIMMAKGNLPDAEEAFAAIHERSIKDGCPAESSKALHSLGFIAQRRGNIPRAIQLMHAALQDAAKTDHERVLLDLATSLIVAERYDAARDALAILEVTAITQEIRTYATINMVIVAARSGDQETFVRLRSGIEEATLPVEARVNYLIESARGLRTFGDEEAARTLLYEAQTFAEKYNLNRSIFEIETLLRGSVAPVPQKQSRAPVSLDEGPVLDVARSLRRMAEELTV